jgi:hypothetical protein
VIRIGSLDQSEPAVTLLQAESSMSYASGHVLFAVGPPAAATLMARPFDPVARTFIGDAVPIAQDVSTEGSRYVGASASANGILVHGQRARSAPAQLTWLDSAGMPIEILDGTSQYTELRLSPNERYVAVSEETRTPGTGAFRSST